MRIVFSCPVDIDHILLKARYQRLWEIYGSNIVNGLETASGVSFLRGVKVNLGIKEADEDWSNSGVSGESAIEIFHTKNSALEEELLWTLCHELGHRLLGQHKLVIDEQELRISWDEANFEAHRILFIFLFDAIRLAFSKHKADAILQSARDNYFSHEDSAAIQAYQKSWLWVDSLSHKQRQELTRRLFKDRLVLLPYK